MNTFQIIAILYYYENNQAGLNRKHGDMCISANFFTVQLSTQYTVSNKGYIYRLMLIFSFDTVKISGAGSFTI